MRPNEFWTPDAVLGQVSVPKLLCVCVCVFTVSLYLSNRFLSCLSISSICLFYLFLSCVCLGSSRGLALPLRPSRATSRCATRPSTFLFINLSIYLYVSSIHLSDFVTGLLRGLRRGRALGRDSQHELTPGAYLHTSRLPVSKPISIVHHTSSNKLTD